MVNAFKKTRRGASMVEYAVLLGSVCLICLVGMSFLGNKTGDIIGALATTLPGANVEDDLSIVSHRLVEFRPAVFDADYIEIDASLIGANDSNPTPRMAQNVGYDENELEDLVSDLFP